MALSCGRMLNISNHLCADLVAKSSRQITNQVAQAVLIATDLAVQRECKSMIAEPKLHHQLLLLGLGEARRLADAAPTKAAASRVRNRIESAHDLLSDLPSPQDLAFQHAGLCQTCLPHRRPKYNHTVWKRQSGRFTLFVRPGIVTDRVTANRANSAISDGASAVDADYVGVPYGPKSRLIMIFLQTEGVRSRTVPLGKNLSAFLRSLGVPNTGGPRGAIAQVKEQFTRIAGSIFTLTWDGGGETVDFTNAQIVERGRLWRMSSTDWSATVELSEGFHNYLCQHAVALDKRAVSHLQNNSLGLDLYALFAYRLPRLQRELRLSWEALQGQIGSEYTQMRDLARHVRSVMPDVKIAYPHANVEVGKGGLLLRPSKPSVPKTQVGGFRLLTGPSSE